MGSGWTDRSMRIKPVVANAPPALFGALNNAHAPRRPLQDSPVTLNTQLYVQLYERKLSRFQQFAVLYPEACWVFVGDNGQAWALLQCSVAGTATGPWPPVWLV